MLFFCIIVKWKEISLLKIIGITGKSGAGKTEFSKYLSEKDSVGVIHADDLLSVAKKKYFGAFLQAKEKGTEELSSKNPKLKVGAKKFFYSNKILFNGLMKFRSLLIKKSMLDKIEMFRRLGKEMIFIDDWALNTHSYIKNELSEIYVIQRPFVSRRTALRDREDWSVKESKVWDIPFAFNFYKVPEGENVTTLNNEGTIEEWHEQAERVYERYHTKTFDEKYVLSNANEITNRSFKQLAKEKLEKIPQIERERTIENK